MKKILIAIIALIVALSSCTKNVTCENENSNFEYSGKFKVPNSLNLKSWKLEISVYKANSNIYCYMYNIYLCNNNGYIDTEYTVVSEHNYNNFNDAKYDAFRFITKNMYVDSNSGETMYCIVKSKNEKYYFPSKALDKWYE